MRPAYWEIRRPTQSPQDPATRQWIGGTHPSIVLGRKFCTGCGHWRHLCDFAPASHGPRARCRACTRAYQREQWRTRPPAQVEDRREYRRIYEEGHRRRLGVPLRNFHHRHWVSEELHEPLGRLPIEPLVAAMTAHYRRQRANGHPDWSWEDLAADSGLSYRTITRYVNGVNKWAQIDNADRIAIAIGVPLMLIYPFEEEA